MNKKIKVLSITVLSLVCLLCCTFALAACGDSGETGGETPSGGKPSKTYTVVYDANGGKFDKGEIDIGDGETIDDGADISSDGSKMTVTTTSVTLFEPLRMPELAQNAFCGWAKDRGGNELWDFEKDAVSDDITLYAVWAQSFDFVLSEDGSHYIVRGIGALSGDVEIPETHNRKPVTEIAKEAFKNSRALTGIIIPDSVTVIGDGAFKNATKLESISFGEGVTRLPDGVLYDCTSLTVLALPKALKKIDYNAFGTDGAKAILEVRYAGTVDDWCGIDMDCSTSMKANPLANEKAELYINGEAVSAVTINAEKINDYAFYMCKTIERVTIGKNVKEIGSKAFFRNGITSLKFDNGSSLVSIGESAFIGNEITELALPNSPLTLEASAFEDCNKLLSVDLGGTKKAYDKAFENCYLIESLDLGAVEYLGDNAFNGNSVLNEDGSLASVVIPETVWYLGISCFGNQAKLSSVTFEGSARTATWQVSTQGKIENVSGETLANPTTAASKIRSTGTWIRLFGEVTYDSNNVATGVKDKNGVGALVVPSTVTKIAANAFKDLSGLRNLTIQSSVTEIGDGFVDGCDGLETISVAASNTAYASSNGILYKKNGAILWVSPSIGSTRASGYVTIPNGVKIIPAGIFANRNIWCVVIPESVTEIGNGAFEGCPIEIAEIPAIAIPYIVNDMLLSVDIISGTSIPDEAFKNCANLTFVGFLDADITKIGASAFENCVNLQSITITDKITMIGDGAFDGCVGIERIEVDENNTSFVVQDGFLYNADKTKILLVTKAVHGKIIIPDGMTEIKSGVFSNNAKITSITIPDSVTEIGENAFAGCTGLTSIEVSDSNTTFASQNGILYNKAKTQIIYIPQGIKGEIVIPSGVESIGARAFENCTGITSIVLPDGITEIGDYAFSGCKELTSIAIPDSVTKIGSSAFRGCSKLTSISIPRGVTEIGSSAFRGCGKLTSITVSGVIKNIGYNAFYGCNSLTSITYNGTKADWNVIPKFDIPPCTVHCSDGDIEIK